MATRFRCGPLLCVKVPREGFGNNCRAFLPHSLFRATALAVRNRSYL